MSSNTVRDILSCIGENSDQLRRLEAQIASRVGVVPFVGAGLSVTYEYPTWRAFLTQQAQQANIESAIRHRLDAGQYEEAAEDLLSTRGQRAFHDAIEATFGPHVIAGRTLNGVVMQLPQLASGPVVTTNFDPLLETAFSQAGMPFDSIAVGARADTVVAAARSNARILLKLHGDAEDRTGRILTREDYERTYGTDGGPGSTVDVSLPLPRLLGLLLMSRVILFVGCSLEQDRTVLVLRQIASAYPEVAQFAIVPAPASNELFQRRARFLSECGIRPIWYPMGRYDLIEPLLAYLADAARRTSATPDHKGDVRAESGPGQVPTSTAIPVGLPRAIPLLGRDAEVTELAKQLQDASGQPVVALHGLGGIGKTAVAAELAARLSTHPSFPGGAVWVPCHDLRGPEGIAEVWSRVARRLGLEAIAETAQADAQRVALGQALAQRPRTLLAFDNVEQGLDVGQLLEIVSISGRTAIVLTSREVVLPHRTLSRSLGPLTAEAGETLYITRLRQRDPSRPTEAEKQLVPVLVAAVGGLPLALELLAAYAGIQRCLVDDEVQQLQADGVSAAALRSEPERALALIFERSWRALPRRQQRLLAALGLVWSSSLPRDYALALACAAVDEGDQPDPNVDLAALINYSLVEPMADGRLRVHPMLRSFGYERFRKLEPEERKRSGEPLIRFWIDRLEKNSDFEHVDAMDAEAELLMGLLFLAHETGEHVALLDLVGAMRDWWDLRGRVQEAVLGRTWALESAIAQNDPTLECWARHELALIQRQVGAWDEARNNLERGLALAEAGARPEVICNVVRELAVLDETTGRMDDARRGYERARDLAGELGVQHLMDRAECDLAVLNSKVDRLDEARAGLLKALPSIEARADLNALRETLHNLALVNRKQGRREEARDGYARALVLAGQLKQPRAVRDEIYHLAQLELEAGNIAIARSGFEQALVLCHELLDRPFGAYTLLALGDVEEAAGNSGAADSRYEEALQLARALGDPVVERAALHALGVRDMRRGKPEEAQAKFKQALELARTVTSPSYEALELRWLGLAIAYAGDSDRGCRLVRDGIEIDAQFGKPQALGEDYRALAEIEHVAGNRDGAMEALRTAAGYYEKVSSPQLEEVRRLLEEW